MSDTPRERANRLIDRIRLFGGIEGAPWVALRDEIETEIQRAQEPVPPEVDPQQLCAVALEAIRTGTGLVEMLNRCDELGFINQDGAGARVAECSRDFGEAVSDLMRISLQPRPDSS